MPREKKVAIVDNLTELFRKCSIGILTDYRGITANELTDLRRQFRGKGIDFKVVKNTLARFAAEKAGREDLSGLFQGPVALVFGYGSEVETAKTLDEYNRNLKTSLEIRGGFLTERRLTAVEITSLAKLPSREVLIGRVMGGMQAPIIGLLFRLSAPLQGIIGVLQARINQLEAK